jgi:hypothetical protein
MRLDQVIVDKREPEKRRRHVSPAHPCARRRRRGLARNRAQHALDCDPLGVAGTIEVDRGRDQPARKVPRWDTRKATTGKALRARIAKNLGWAMRGVSPQGLSPAQWRNNLAHSCAPAPGRQKPPGAGRSKDRRLHGGATRGSRHRRAGPSPFCAPRAPARFAAPIAVESRSRSDEYCWLSGLTIATAATCALSSGRPDRSSTTEEAFRPRSHR